MKSSYIIAFVALLFASTIAAGQAKPAPPPSKGYYSIGTSTPVAGAGTLLASDTGLVTGISKGYYSIQPDALKTTSSSWLPNRRKPVITKGYYSIGDHINRFPRPERK